MLGIGEFSRFIERKNLSLAARQTGLIMHKTGILSLEIILSAFLLM